MLSLLSKRQWEVPLRELSVAMAASALFEVRPQHD
jgi:hypothetical protein